MAEPWCRGCRCLLSLPPPPPHPRPPSLGVVAELAERGDVRGSKTRGHSSPKNVLRNTGPINLFYLALLEKKKPNPTPNPSVVRIFFK